MITVKFDLSKFDAAKIHRLIGNKVAEVVAKTTSLVYNSITLGEYPYWSGQYAASWTLNIGSPEYVYLPDAGYSSTGRGAAFHYSRPNPKQVLPNYAAPYSKGYVVNTSDHAYKIEYEGTKTSDFHPWLIAHMARTNAVMGAKFF